MPSIAGHMVIAKLVSENLGINDLDFIRGNILPDITNQPNSHHKIQGKIFLIPDINFFKEKLNLNNKLELGYLTHLLLDKYFLEEYIPNNMDNLKIFETKVIYREYDLINYKLVKEFRLDVPFISKTLNEITCDIDKEKLKKNIDCLSNQETGETLNLNFEKFSKFLNKISFKISEEVKQYLN